MANDVLEGLRLFECEQLEGISKHHEQSYTTVKKHLHDCMRIT